MQCHVGLYRQVRKLKGESVAVAVGNNGCVEQASASRREDGNVEVCGKGGHVLGNLHDNVTLLLCGIGQQAGLIEWIRTVSA